jgi:AcrR family transcriptional regulator
MFQSIEYYMAKKSVSEAVLTPAKILDTACDQVRRFGEAKTNVVDIARALGTSHTAIYRHFRSKAEVFNSIISAAMRDEEELAKTIVDAPGPAPKRLEDFVFALHRRKKDRLANEPELYQLYRRIVDERPELIQNYSKAMTKLIAAILADGVQRGEYKIKDVGAAAEVVRDAVTVFIHPVLVEAAAKAGMSMELSIRRVLATLNGAFKAGVRLP